MMIQDSEKVLLVEDDVAFGDALSDSFLIAGLRTELHRDGRAALASLNDCLPGVIVTDIRMPRLDGNDLLQWVHARDSELPVVMMTGHGDIPMAVEALKRGAYDFLAKPFVTDQLIATVRRALETRHLIVENRQLRKAVLDADETLPLVGQTPAMAQIRQTIRQVANNDVNILIEGETGTGKELVARLLHRSSLRRGRSFVSLDCAGLSDAIINETLFGTRTRRGRLAEAHRGTLFLDGVEDMSPTLQGLILGVVEEQQMPSGAGETTAVDLRFIASTKTDLGQLVKDGRFRAELLYHLETVRIRMPPLRERMGDVSLLFNMFLDEASRLHGSPRPIIDSAMLNKLLSSAWPGNLRELNNYATQVALGITPRSVPQSNLGLVQQIEDFETNILSMALQRFGGDVTKVADALRLPRRSLYARLQRLRINPADFRSQRM